MKTDLNFLYNKIKNKENFSLVRYGDGERNIINNVPCNRKGFDFDITNKEDQQFRNDLIESYNFSGQNYYKGLEQSKMDENIVSACVFVNENYVEFIKEFSKLFNNCVFIGNELGMPEYLPFKPERYIKIKDNAWKDYSCSMLDVFLSRWLANKKGIVVLIAGGPFANVLIYKLYRINPNNTYLNIGSTYDPFLYGRTTRQYQLRLEQ